MSNYGVYIVICLYTAFSPVQTSCVQEQVLALIQKVFEVLMLQLKSVLEDHPDLNQNQDLKKDPNLKQRLEEDLNQSQDLSENLIQTDKNVSQDLTQNQEECKTWEFDLKSFHVCESIQSFFNI